jgi:hypothetical protein
MNGGTHTEKRVAGRIVCYPRYHLIGSSRQRHWDYWSKEENTNHDSDNGPCDDCPASHVLNDWFGRIYAYS